jgi:hypothetical protein
MNKKLLTTLAFSWMLFTQMKAQITITSSDFVSEGKQFTMVSSNPGNYMPGGTGSQTWDFSALTNDGETLYDVQQPAWTPFASSYPTANMAFQIGTDYQYLKIDGTGVIGLGQTGFGGNIPLNPAEKMLTFPTTLNTTFNATSKFKFQIDTNVAQTFGTIDSIRIVGTRVKTSLCDAYGNITTPAGTFPSLRVKETVIETDSIFAKLVTLLGSTWISLPAGFGIPNPIVDTTESYTWYGNNTGFKILSFSYDTAASGIEWLKALPVASGLQSISNGFSGKVYPSPATTELFVNASGISNIDIYSLDGALVKSEKINSGNATNIEDLSNGNYLVLGKNQHSEIILKQIVAVQKNK